MAGHWENLPIHNFLSQHQCKGNPRTAKKDGLDKDREHDFVLCEPCIWLRFPQALRERHKGTLCTNAADDCNGRLFVTEGFCCKTLKDETGFTETIGQMNDACDQNSAMLCQHEQGQETALALPDFNVKAFQSFKPLGTTNALI